MKRFTIVLAAVVLVLAGLATAQVASTTMVVTDPARTVDVSVDGQAIGSLTIPARTRTETVVVTVPQVSAWDAVLRDLPEEPFAPLRTVVVGDGPSLRTALAGLRAGDLVQARAPFTVTGPTVFVRAQLATRARVDLHGVSFRTGAAGSLEHGVAIVGARNVELAGGDISTPGNSGLWIQDSSDVSWRDLDVHDTAGNGIIAQGINRAQTGIDIQARVWQAGLDAARLDPHVEKGTGVHAVYLGGSTFGTSGRFVLDVRDQPTGAAVQAGAHLVDSDLWLRAARVTFVARQQVGGNALQLWGANRDLRVHYLEAEDLGGRAVEVDALESTASGIVVELGRAVRTRLLPEYATHPAVTYRDVS